MKTRIVTVLISMITCLGFSQSKIVFTYDSAGNQVTRNFCKDGDCGTAAREEVAEVAKAAEEVEEKEQLENNDFDKSIAVFPNPTKGQLTISWNSEYSNAIREIVLIDVVGKAHKVDYSSRSDQATIDLSNWPNGLYVVRFILTDGNSLTKKIVKK